MIRKKSTRGPSWRQRSPVEPERQRPLATEKQTKGLAPSDDLKCKVCGRTFHKRAMLKFHLLTHNMTTKKLMSSAQVESSDEKLERELMEADGSGGSKMAYEKSQMNEEEKTMEASGSSIVVTRQASSSSRDEVDDEDISDEMYKCIACGKLCHDQEILDTHIVQKHGARLKCQCQVCHGNKRSDIASLMEKYHIQDGEEDVRVFRCLICRSVFFLGCKCVYHIEQSHNSIILKYPFECANCGKMFEMVSLLYEHQKQEHEQLEKLSRCGYCKDSFKFTSLLESHIRQMHQITKDPIISSVKETSSTKLPVTDVVSSSSSTAHLPKQTAIAKKSTRSPLPGPSVSSTSSDFVNADEFICEICNRKSQSRIGYTNHMVVYHKIKPDDLPLVRASGFGKQMSQKKTSGDSNNDSDDDNWRPSRAKSTCTPMRSSTRLALAASRREVEPTLAQLQDEFNRESDEDTHQVVSKAIGPTSEAESSHSEASYKPAGDDDDPEDDDDGPEGDDDGPEGDDDGPEDDDDGPEGDDEAEDDDDVKTEDEEEDTVLAHSPKDIPHTKSPGSHEGDSKDNEVDKCKNCPACKQEAAQAAAAKALAEELAIKRELQEEETENEDGIPLKLLSTRQPQLVIKDVYSLHPSGSSPSSIQSQYSEDTVRSYTSVSERSLDHTSPPPPKRQRQTQQQPTPMLSTSPIPVLVPHMPPSGEPICQSCSGGRTTTSRCVHCDLVFLDEVMHTIHMGWHGRTNPFDCHACGRQCTDKYAFITHIFRDPHL